VNQSQVNDELLSAYLDGEVTPEERQRIEKAIETSPQWKKRHQQFLETSNAVRNLPQVELGKDLTPSIFNEIRKRQQAPAEPQQPLVEVGRSRTSDRLKDRRSKQPVWVVVAASLLLVATGGMIAVQMWQTPAGETIAKNSQPKKDPSGPDPAVLAQDTASDRLDSTEPKIEPKSDNFPDIRNFPKSSDSVGEPEPTKLADNPVGIRIKVRSKDPQDVTKPEMPDSTNSGVMAKTAVTVGVKDTSGLDTEDLPKLPETEVASQFRVWLDQDKDGTVSDAEANQSWQRVSVGLKQSDQLSDQLLTWIDENADQKISSSEVERAAASIRWLEKRSPLAIAQLWNRLDADGNGFWTKGDYRQNTRYAGNSAAVMSGVLKEIHLLADRSQDGRVSRTEIALSADLAIQRLSQWGDKLLLTRYYEETNRLMDRFDRNRDGRLVGLELRRLMTSETQLESQLGKVAAEGLSAYELYSLLESTDQAR